MGRKKWSKLLFAAYCLLMLWLLYGQRMGQSSGKPYWTELRGNLLLEPLDTIRRFLWVLRHSSNEAYIRHAVVNLVGNVVMFVPLGFFVPILWRRTGKLGWHLFSMALIIVAVELTQLFTLLGTCDVDDLILNLVGTTIGFLLWKLWQYFVRKE